MDTIEIKPSFSKILLSGFLMGSVLFPITLLLNNANLTDIIPVGFVLVYVYLASLLLCGIIFNLSYFVVRIDGMYLSGPCFLVAGWRQTQILIENIDIKNIKSFRWLGFYLIRSMDGAIITICCFDENQYEKLITAISSQLRV